MDKESEGTPNPLTKNTQPETSNDPEAVAEKEAKTLDANPAGPIQPTEIKPEAKTAEMTTDEADPMARPMEVAPPSEVKPVKKQKKTKIIIGFIVALVALVGCGAALAMAFLWNQNNDPVAAAVNKLLSGKGPSNVAIEGDVSVTMTDPAAEISSFKLALEGEGVRNSMINSMDAKLDMKLNNGGSFSLELSEVYAATGDLYLRLDGLNNALADPYLLEDTSDATTEDCYLEETCLNQDDELFALLTLLKENIDGEWIKLSADELTEISSGMAGADQDNQMVCLANLANDLTNNNTLAKTYQENPFLHTATGTVKIASERDPIYQVAIDEQKLTDFVNQSQNSRTMKELNACLGYEGVTVTAEDIAEEINNLPDIYVEIDGDYNFTRIFLAPEIEGEMTMVIDFSLNYPNNVNISEPVEYQDLTTIMQKIFLNMYDGDTIEGIEELELDIET